MPDNTAQLVTMQSERRKVKPWCTLQDRSPGGKRVRGRKKISREATTQIHHLLSGEAGPEDVHPQANQKVSGSIRLRASKASSERCVGLSRG